MAGEQRTTEVLSRAHVIASSGLIMLGLITFASPPQRWSAAAFRPFLDTPGGMWTWGSAFLLGGTGLGLSALASRQVQRAAFLVICALYGVMFLWLSYAALVDPKASLWGPVFVLVLALHVGNIAEGHYRPPGARGDP